MANISQVPGQAAQSDRAREREANPNDRGNLRRYGLVFSLLMGIAIVAVVVTAFTLSGSEETTAAVSHVGDHSNTLPMGHVLLTEWNVSGLNSILGDELKTGESALELHNDGQTVHRLAIWRGGEVQADQVVGGALIAETGYIQPGEFTTLDVDMEPGEYVLICSVPGHTARGMYATVQLQ